MTNPQIPGFLQADEPADWRNDPNLSATWKYRFDFFEKHGVTPFAGPTPEQKAAFKALSFGERVKVNMNFFAFFLSFLYLGIGLKMWRQALILLGIILVIGLIGAIFNLPDGAMRGAGIGLQMMVGMRANALYYLKRTQGDIGWKFF